MLGGSRSCNTYVRSELQVRDASLELRVVGVVQVTVDDLLGESKGSVQPDESALIYYCGCVVGLVTGDKGSEKPIW